MCETGMDAVSSASGLLNIGGGQRLLSDLPDYPVGLSLPPSCTFKTNRDEDA